MTLNPCPFCKSTDLAKSRFTRSYLIDRDTTFVSEESDDTFGAIFRIKCECGCSLTISGDRLYEMVEDSVPYVELNRLSVHEMNNKMWVHMEDIWNRD